MAITANPWIDENLGFSQGFDLFRIFPGNTTAGQVYAPAGEVTAAALSLFPDVTRVDRLREELYTINRESIDIRNRFERQTVELEKDLVERLKAIGYLQ